ncbi:hypothetical protein PVAP13_4KG184800 [Panicum virgatum]|uniref:Uncharacterized protein n=1 Tax=Panicum virgatum TaxID=38727 RepID=A0A8T0TNI1_PANVG|nr:hypothetical protein PVAP13_4KG184800 [Panicum virgatum]
MFSAAVSQSGILLYMPRQRRCPKGILTRT